MSIPLIVRGAMYDFLCGTAVARIAHTLMAYMIMVAKSSAMHIIILFLSM